MLKVGINIMNNMWTAKYWNKNQWIDIELINIKSGMTIYVVEPDGNVVWNNVFNSSRLKVTKDACYNEDGNIEIEFIKGEVELND